MKDNKVLEAIKLLRPKQWIKNLFVFAALIFSGQGRIFQDIGFVLIAFALFSFAASCVYIFNDIKDVEEDKKHPRKKNRPIAKGTISKGQAIVMLIVLLGGTLYTGYIVNEELFLVILSYLIMNVFYSIGLKKIIILDVIIIAVGFVLRVLAGAVAISVSLSSWIVITTGLISLYLGFSKRKNELAVLAGNAHEHRKTLSEYTMAYLDKITSMLLGLTLISYILYVVLGSNNPSMIFTIPFVIYGALRYEYLVSAKELGGSPEEVFFLDKPFLLNIFMWGVSSVLAVYI